jgi:hypothetical protein
MVHTGLETGRALNYDWCSNFAASFIADTFVPVNKWTCRLIIPAGQFHHLISSNVLMSASLKRFFISRAGLPPTME